MTYDQFKRELFRNVSLSQKAADGQVDLWEQGEWAEKDFGHSVINYVDLIDRERAAGMVQEDYLCLQWGGAVAPQINYWNVRSLYEDYCREGWQSVLPRMTGLEENVGEGEAGYRELARQLTVRMQNYSRNRGFLEGCACLRYGDMALVLCLCVEEGEEVVDVPVLRTELEKWKTCADGVFAGALITRSFRDPPRLFRAGDVRFQYDFGAGAFLAEKEAQTFSPGSMQEGMKGYRLTTAVRRYGAVAIFYPGVMDRLAELMQGDYYVGFLSVDEAVIHPVCCRNPHEMREGIRRINVMNREGEILSEGVYRYWAAGKRLLEIY